jgi:hypothetical protein
MFVDVRVASAMAGLFHRSEPRMDPRYIGPVIVVVLVLLVTLVYWFGPILIRFTMRQAAEPELHAFDPSDPLLPLQVAVHFRRVRAALEPAGFEVVEGLALPDQTPRVKAVLLLLVHRLNKDVAVATAIYGKMRDETTLQTAYVEFVSRYRDGTVVQTNNTDQLSAFAPRPHITSIRLPMIRKPDRLYQLHQAAAKGHHQSSGKVLRLEEEFRGDAVAYLTRTLVEELEGQIETGYMYLSAAENVFRPTWKGAVLMTWGLLWPYSAIRRARRDAKARRLLKELDA